MELHESDYVFIQTSVPVAQADAVRRAMGDAGAGEQGKYAYCSGSFKMNGRFIPLAGASPAIGEIGKAEIVEEEAIQMLCHKERLEKVIEALKAAHPYEEPPIDIFPRYELQ